MCPSTTDGRPALGSTLIGHAGVLGEVAQVLLHLRRAGGAVDADDVGLHGVERARAPRRSRCRRACARWSPSSPAPAAAPPRPAAAIARREPIIAALTWQQVEAVSMRSRSTPPSMQAARPAPRTRRAGRRSGCGRGCGSLVPGPDRAGDEAGAAVGRVAVGDLAGDAGGGDVELVGLLGDGVLVEHDGEAIRSWRSRARRRRRRGRPRASLAMTSGRVRHEHLVAALELAPAEVVGGEVESWTKVPNAPSNTMMRSSTASR